MAGRVGRIREDGLTEYLGRGKTRRPRTIPLGQADSTTQIEPAQPPQGVVSGRRAERGVGSGPADPKASDGPAGRERGERDQTGREVLPGY